MLISFSVPLSASTPQHYHTARLCNVPVRTYLCGFSREVHYTPWSRLHRGRESSDVVKSLSVGFRKSYTPRETYIWFSYCCGGLPCFE